jgi:hypothetical protein
MQAETWKPNRQSDKVEKVKRKPSMLSDKVKGMPKAQKTGWQGKKLRPTPNRQSDKVKVTPKA